MISYSKHLIPVLSRIKIKNWNFKFRSKLWWFWKNLKGIWVKERSKFFLRFLFKGIKVLLNITGFFLRMPLFQLVDKEIMFCHSIFLMLTIFSIARSIFSIWGFDTILNDGMDQPKPIKYYGEWSKCFWFCFENVDNR